MTTCLPLQIKSPSSLSTSKRNVKQVFASQSNKNLTVLGLRNNRPRIMSIRNKRYPYYPEVILRLEDLAQLEIERAIHHKNAKLCFQ